jgi:hypothetical protein
MNEFVVRGARTLARRAHPIPRALVGDGVLAQREETQGPKPVWRGQGDGRAAVT